jgi:hypothetical protein
MNTDEELRRKRIGFQSVFIGVHPWFVSFLLCAGLSLSAATVTITVSSGDSAQFLQSARVELSPLGRDAITNDVGVAEFLDVAP